MEIEEIAKVCHEVNKAYCEALGDNSQTSWENAPQWQKDSAILGVKFHIENPNAGADSIHNSWMKQKIDDGWIYGPIKDADKKQHPCIIPFEMLPNEQKAKDYLFKQVVYSLYEL
jgi:cytochrome c1